MNWFHLNKKKLEYHSCDTIFLKDWMTYILYMNDNYINTYPCLCIYYHSVWYDRKSCYHCLDCQFYPLVLGCLVHFFSDKITTLRIVIEDETETEYSALPRRVYAVYYNLFSVNNNCNIASCPFLWNPTFGMDNKIIWVFAIGYNWQTSRYKDRILSYRIVCIKVVFNIAILRVF